MSAAVQTLSSPAADSAQIVVVRRSVRDTPVFGGLDDRIVDRLTIIATLVDVPEGFILCRQGEPSDRLFIILDGQAAVSADAANGATAVLDVIRAGRTIGLSALLARLPRTTGAQAISRCHLLSIDAQGLLALVAQEPALVTALLRAAAEDSGALVRQVCDLKLRTAAERLGCYLLSLSPNHIGNSVAMRLPFDKRLLAARLGCRQENLSRAFATLREVGVETHGARVILHDIAKLREYSQPDDPFDSKTA